MDRFGYHLEMLNDKIYYFIRSDRFFVYHLYYLTSQPELRQNVIFKNICVYDVFSRNLMSFYVI